MRFIPTIFAFATIALPSIATNAQDAAIRLVMLNDVEVLEQSVITHREYGVGVVINEEGLVATPRSSIENASLILAVEPGGRFYDVSIRYLHPEYDLAYITVKGLARTHTLADSGEVSEYLVANERELTPSDEIATRDAVGLDGVGNVIALHSGERDEWMDAKKIRSGLRRLQIFGAPIRFESDASTLFPLLVNRNGDIAGHVGSQHSATGFALLALATWDRLQNISDLTTQRRYMKWAIEFASAAIAIDAEMNERYQLDRIAHATLPKLSATKSESMSQTPANTPSQTPPSSSSTSKMSDLGRFRIEGHIVVAHGPDELALGTGFNFGYELWRTEIGDFSIGLQLGLRFTAFTYDASFVGTSQLEFVLNAYLRPDATGLNFHAAWAPGLVNSKHNDDVRFVGIRAGLGYQLHAFALGLGFWAFEMPAQTGDPLNPEDFSLVKAALIWFGGRV